MSEQESWMPGDEEKNDVRQHFTVVHEFFCFECNQFFCERGVEEHDYIKCPVCQQTNVRFGSNIKNELDLMGNPPVTETQETSEEEGNVPLDLTGNVVPNSEDSIPSDENDSDDEDFDGIFPNDVRDLTEEDEDDDLTF